MLSCFLCTLLPSAKHDTLHHQLPLNIYELLADEINAMMEVDVLCKLSDLSVKDEGEGEDEEDEAINSKRESVSFDEVNALAVQLKSLQVQASELGEDCHTVYLALGDASNSIWSIYRKQQNIKKAKKINTAKQTSMKHFLKNK